MGQVVGQVFSRQHQAAGEFAVRRRRDAGQPAQRVGGGGRLGDRADAADARHDGQRVGRIATDQDLLETAEQRRIDARGDNPAGVDVEADLEVALDAVERADLDPLHLPPFLTPGRTTVWSTTALSRTRFGVADLDSAASATNQAFGMSAGRPIGMPASLGVSWKA